MSLRSSREARRTARTRRRRLERDLAGYTTFAQRQELVAVLDRYPEDETREVRAILERQARTVPLAAAYSVHRAA